MSAPAIDNTAAPSVEALATLDLFALGRLASAARDARLGRHGTFARARQLLGDGTWRGPRDAADSQVDEADVAALGGLTAARAAGADLLVASSGDVAQAAAAAGLRVLLKVPFAGGENDGERLVRLAALADAALWGVMPAPVGEPYGLDTVRCFALCRLALPAVQHVVADVAALGPRLAQMAFGFGADALLAPIVAERALRLGVNANNPALTRKEAATLIRGAGLIACERLADGGLQEVPA